MTVVGTKKNEKITNTDISVEKFQIEELAQIPTFMGEKDIMKTLQLTPGIQTRSPEITGCGHSDFPLAPDHHNRAIHLDVAAE